MALRSLKEFCLPSSGAEVVSLLGKYGDGALVLAGGTFVHGLEARGLIAHVEALIDLQRLGLATVTNDGGSWRVGATTTFATLQAAARAAGAGMAAIDDALTYPPNQIRNVATIGGCLAAACPFFDLPTVLLALDASVTAESATGRRTLPVSDLFGGLFVNTLEPAEFLVGASLPVPAAKTASAFLKLETNANDLAIVNAAVRYALDGRGRIADARVALGGGVDERPVRSPSAEQVLNGATPGEEAFRAAGEAVGSDIEPMSDHRASGRYRKAVAKVMVARALARAAARL